MLYFSKKALHKKINIYKYNSIPPIKVQRLEKHSTKIMEMCRDCSKAENIMFKPLCGTYYCASCLAKHQNISKKYNYTLWRVMITSNNEQVDQMRVEKILKEVSEESHNQINDEGNTFISIVKSDVQLEAQEALTDENGDGIKEETISDVLWFC